jgi:type VII secretion-associated serine protease mycosin
MRLRSGLAALAGVLVTLAIGVPARADAVRDQQWSLGVLKVAEAHAINQGEGVTVAVVDSGVDAGHPDLTGNVLKGIDVSRGGDGTTADRTGHGTAIASLIAGHGHGRGGSAGILGVAPKAKILPVRIFPARGALHPDDAAHGIVAAVDAGATVICIASSGSTTPKLEAAVAYAVNKQALIVAAAGSTETVTGVTWPARYPTTIAVAGTHRSGQASENSPRGDEIEVAAPGDEIVSATLGGGYATNSGTSNATALVAGVAALVRSKFPELDMVGAYRRVRYSSTDAGEPGYDQAFGHGVVNAAAALTATIPAVGAPSASASEEPAVARERRDTGLSAYVIALAVVAGAVMVLGPPALIVLLVVLLVRRSRRKRREREREQAAAWTPEEFR